MKKDFSQGSENLQLNEYSDEDLNFREIINTLKRGKNFIFSFTALVSALGIISTYFVKPIYKGGFNIVAAEKKSNLASNLGENPLLNIFQGGLSLDTRTQEFILNSPLVLKPVYDFAKDNYAKRGEEVEGMQFQNWMDEKLEIQFKPRTRVLSVEFIDSDKDFIINILTMISSQYKNYSKRDKEKDLTKAIDHLERQKIKLKNNLRSNLYSLNQFSIKNGLGDLDGFVALSSNDQISNLQNIEILSKLQNLDIPADMDIYKKENAGIRFRNQFLLLEKYEAEYVNLSAKLTKNSTYLKNLKLRIDNLRNSLKRPNEILIKYRELTKKVKRDEGILNNVEKQLGLFKLEKAKQIDPWEIISIPTIEGKVFPKRSQTAIIYFILSFLFSSLVQFFREKKSGIVYEFYSLKNYFEPAIYLDTLSSSNLELSNEIIKSNFNIKDKNNSKVGIIYLKSFNSKITKPLENIFMKGNDDFENINIEDLNRKETFENIILITSLGSLNLKDISTINKYIKIHKKKIKGWFLVDENE